MLKETKNIASLCVETSLRTIPESARLIEYASYKGKKWCKESDRWDNTLPHLGLGMTYHGSKIIRELSTTFIDSFFTDKYK